MQKMYSRTSPARSGASENSKTIRAQQIEEALRESVRQNAAHIGYESENTSQIVTDVNSLVQRLRAFRWASWITRSWISGTYEISCTVRANECKGKSLAIYSSTTLPLTQQRALSMTPCNGKRQRIVPRALSIETIS
jgi:hypothetical protein